MTISPILLEHPLFWHPLPPSRLLAYGHCGQKLQTLRILFIKLGRGEICVANFKAPLQMVLVWTGF